MYETMFFDLALGFALSFCVNWLLRPVFRRAGWVDAPGERKQHARPTVISGGFGLFCAIAIGLGIRHYESTSIGLTLAAVSLMFMAGFLDDRKPIRARYRLLVQIVASFALIVGNGAVLQHLPIAKDIDLTVVPGIAIALSLFWMVGLINAINMSDGSDGVSSGYGAIAILGVLAFYMLSGATPETTLPVAFSTMLLVLGGIFAFFVFNYPILRGRHAIAFLGDGGSMLLGIVVGWALLKAGLPSGAARPLSFWFAIWFIALPLFDATYCILRRVLSGKDPMTPDRRHLHHLLKAYGLSKREVALSAHLAALSLALVGLVLWYQAIPEYVACWLFLAGIAIYSLIVTKLWSALDGSALKQSFDTPTAARIK
jgi:UDP-GlcNAc:undecaprenyl-phosphate/decaprenyl-phosphate GlcNAc-1-phosphate transferase